MPDLESRPAAVQTVCVKAQLAAAGRGHRAARPGSRPGPDGGHASARVAEARSRARERGDRQRQALRPLGVVFLAVVLTASAQAHPGPALYGAGLAVALLLLVYAAAVLTAISVGWARRGPAAQAAVITLIGGCGVALAVVQPHGPVEVAASLGVWIAAVRLPAVPAAVAAGAITAALAVAVGLTEQPAAQSAITAVLLCLLLAVTGQFIRRGRQSQDRTELLLAQLQDAREAEAAAAALAERSRIAGELHDVLAHSLSGLAIQLQGARKLAGKEAVSEALRAAIDRSAELTKAGLADARQAVSALRGEQLPTLDQLGTLVEDFRRDTGADATLRIDGTSPAAARRGQPGPVPRRPGVADQHRPVRARRRHHRHRELPARPHPGHHRGPPLLTRHDPGGQARAAGRRGRRARPGRDARTSRAGGRHRPGRAGPGGWLVELEVPG